MFLNCMLNWTAFVKEVFDLMISLESDEMTTLLPSDSLTFPIYETFSNCIPEWTAFVKEVFDLIISKWQNDCLTFTDLTQKCGTIIQISPFYKYGPEK